MNIFITGASSGIGEALSRIAVAQGHVVVGAARRQPLLKKIARDLGPAFIPLVMDIDKSTAARASYQRMSKKAGGFDLVILNAGWGANDPAFAWAVDKQTIATNVEGFAALANAAFHEFLDKGRGHLAGVSSMAGLKGIRQASAYNASKAFMDSYLFGLRHKAKKAGLDICVTNIRPGWVKTDMAKADRAFWIAPVDKAAQQIWDALEKRKEHVYVTKRWRLIAWLLRWIPDSLYYKI